MSDQETVLQEYQHHIRQTHFERVHLSHCGVQVPSTEWTFTSIDHAVHSVLNGSRTQPCPGCCAVVIRVLGSAE